MDLKTAYLGLLMVFLATALALAWLWRQHRKYYQGLYFWPLASVLLGLASVLIFFRQSIPDWASIVLVNLLLFVVPVLVRSGFEAFFARPARLKASLTLVGLATLSQAYFTYVLPSLTIRLHLFGLVFGSLIVQLLLFLSRSVPDSEQQLVRPTRLGLLAILLGLVIRSIDLVLIPVRGNEHLLDRQADTFFVLILMGIWILFANTLMILVSRRLMDEVSLERLKFDLIFHQAGDASTLVRLTDFVISDVNESFEQLSGYSRQALVGALALDFHFWADPVWFAGIQQDLRAGLFISSREAMFRRRSGEIVPVLFSGKVMTIQGDPYVLANIKDISEIFELKSRLEKMATYDALTHLPNRVLFADRFSVASAGALRTGRKFAVAIYDLDDFKQVNDTYGHDVGDLLLVAAADRISRTIRLSDTVARFGGDEFVILITDVQDEMSIPEFLQRIVDVHREPFIIQDLQLNISISIGAAVFPDDANNLNDLLRLADQALFQVKRQGKNDWRLSQCPAAQRLPVPPVQNNQA